MNVRNRLGMFAAMAAVLACWALSPALALSQSDIELEQKLGKEASAEADKTLKYITDEALVKRVEKIGREIAAVAKTTVVPAVYGNSDLADYAYSFKVVDDRDVNAFSLPTGYIYINKGLIERVESDDELAGVLAHEIAHAAHHHVLKLVKKQQRASGAFLLILAAVIIGKAGPDADTVVYGAQLLAIAKLNAYSRDAEADADTTAVRYLLKTNYNPVGLLTFIEKLARDEEYDPRAADRGIFMTHPYGKDRVKSITAELERDGVPIDRRAVTNWPVATVRDSTVLGRKLSEVVIGDRLVFQAADTPEAPSAQRATAVAKSINRLLEASPQLWEIRLSHDGTAVYLRQELILDVQQADADFLKTSRQSLATRAKESIQAALLSERMKLIF